MTVPRSPARPARTVAVVGAAVLALAAAAPAHADEAFPATAGSTLVSLSYHGEDALTEGSWGRVYVGSDVGGDYPSADFSADPGGVSALLGIGGPVESRVNTTAAGDGRAEAVSAVSGGFTLDLPGYDEPAVRFSSLRTSLTCDFSGDVVGENRIGSDAEDDRVISVFGTPITADAPEVTATVDVPGRGTTAEVTVESREADDSPAGEGEASTVVRASEEGAALFELTLGAVAVDCPDDGDAAGAEEGARGDGTDGDDGTGEDDASAAEEPDAGQDGAERSGDAPEGADGRDPADGGASGSGSPSPGPGDSTADSPDGGDGDPGGLPVTGAALAGLVAAGVLAVGGGGAALYLARRGKHGGDDGDGDHSSGS